MARCEKCGFDPDEPIGEALEDIPAGGNGRVKLNDNGFLMLVHHQHIIEDLRIFAPNNLEVMKN